MSPRIHINRQPGDDRVQSGSKNDRQDGHVPIGIRVRYAIAIIVALIAAITAYQAHSITQRLARDERQTTLGLHSQTKNRAQNVLLWCSGLNDQAAELERYVAAFQHVSHVQIPRLTLHRIDCAAVAANTLQSTRAP